VHGTVGDSGSGVVLARGVRVVLALAAIAADLQLQLGLHDAQAIAAAATVAKGGC
jgi:hypothetical protein